MVARRSSLAWLTSLGVAACFVAALSCAGRSERTEGDDGAGGSAGGTTGGAGGATGGIGGAGGTGGTTGGSAQPCGDAVATCPPGEALIPPGVTCPVDRSCYRHTVHCQTITCAVPAPTCNALPSCDEGDITLDGACPPDRPCYARELCGTTVRCVDAKCDPELEPDRRYAWTGPDCGLIDFGCGQYTQQFYNECGCGCEQDASCPPSIDCSPQPEPNPACSDEMLARCPFSVVLL